MKTVPISHAERLSHSSVIQTIFHFTDSQIERESIVEEGNSICTSYIKNRLKRSGIFQRKLGIKRVRSSKITQNYEVINDVAHILIEIGTELEKVHPNLFIRVARQIGFGVFSSEHSIKEGINQIASAMFNQGEITWMKIVAFNAIAGGIAVDCARQGHDFLPHIHRAMKQVMEQDIAPWVQTNGGWETVILRYRSQTTSPRSLGAIILIGIWILVVVLLVFVLWLISYVLQFQED